MKMISMLLKISIQNVIWLVILSPPDDVAGDSFRSRMRTSTNRKRKKKGSMEGASWDTTFMAFAVAERARARSRLELIA